MIKYWKVIVLQRGTLVGSKKDLLTTEKKNKSFSKHLKKYWQLYLMVIPGFIFFIMIKYVPMLGITLAFKDYQIFNGFFESPWVGLKHFADFFKYPNFWRVFSNTLIIGVMKIVLTFPFPIILAILMNELRNVHYKKAVQTVFYIPHFFSWVIIAGLTFDLLSGTGIVNSIITFFGGEPILFMQQSKYFRWILVLTHMWRNGGWGTIVILAAIAGINPSLYESACVDGANRIQQIFKITLPLLMPTIVILFLLQMGRFLDVGFDHVFNLLTPMTYSVGDIIDTYVYRIGILEGQYSPATAIGLFQSVIGFIFVFTFNRLSKKVTGGGIW